MIPETDANSYFLIRRLTNSPNKYVKILNLETDFTIGRMDTNRMILISAAISRTHAKISKNLKSGKVFLTNLRFGFWRFASIARVEALIEA